MLALRVIRWNNEVIEKERLIKNYEDDRRCRSYILGQSTVKMWREMLRLHSLGRLFIIIFSGVKSL